MHKNTYTPVTGPLPDDGGRVKVQVVKREVTFDIIGKVFIFLRTEKEKVSIGTLRESIKIQKGDKSILSDLHNLLKFRNIYI